MGSFFPVQSGIPGVRRVDKSQIDNANYFEDFSILGPFWGEAFETGLSYFEKSGNNVTKAYLDYNAIVLNSTVAGLSGKIYSPRVASGLSSVYDTGTDSWSQTGFATPDVTYLRSGGFSYNGELYFIQSSTVTPYVRYFRKYNPSSNTWTALTSMPNFFNDTAAYLWEFMGIYNGAAYFCCFYARYTTGDVPPSTNSINIHKYVFASNTWVDTGAKLLGFIPSLSTGVNETFLDPKPFCRFSAQYDDSSFLINLFKSGRIIKVNATDFSCEHYCTFSNTASTSSIFLQDGVAFLTQSSGLYAYVESTGNFYHVPTRRSYASGYAICQLDGYIYDFAAMSRINIAALASFLKGAKSIAVHMKSFA